MGVVMESGRNCIIMTDLLMLMHNEELKLGPFPRTGMLPSLTSDGQRRCLYSFKV